MPVLEWRETARADLLAIVDYISDDNPDEAQRLKDDIEANAAKLPGHLKLYRAGLTVSDAFRLLLTRVAREKALPFEPLVPNAVTIAAMKQARAGKLPSAKSVEDLMGALRADD